MGKGSRGRSMNIGYAEWAKNFDISMGIPEECIKCPDLKRCMIKLELRPCYFVFTPYKDKQ